jgi:pilus assembly protein FimV
VELDAPDPVDVDISAVDTVARDESPAQVAEDAGSDLSLQSSDLDDLSIGGDTISGEPDESEIEFDLALEDTTEMDSLTIDETLELPKSDSADESLEDLAKSMEESMADLDLSDDELGVDEEDDELDLSLTGSEASLDINFASDPAETEPKLEFDIDDLDLEHMDQADTLALDLTLSDDASPLDQDAVEVPVDGDVEQQSDADEVDTKLNLAKAYIELGDNDGARSILDEVARDGSDAQQTEAQRLIDQLT